MSIHAKTKNIKTVKPCKVDCIICTDEVFSRKIIKCPFCPFSSCLDCADKFLMSIDDDKPRCMSPDCKKVWSYTFVASLFPPSFHNKRYRDRRASLMNDREKSLLPGTQPLVKSIKKKEKNRLKIKELQGESAMYMELIHINKQKCLKLFAETDTHTDEKKPFNDRVFTRACPMEECRGFLSASLKCGICSTYSCKDCHLAKESKDDEKHTCDPDTVETVKLLLSDTKPCPACATPIFKIHGCFAGDTKIPMWNKTVKEARDILIGDILIGDDGKHRIVEDLVSGEDDMYKISQSNANDYVVNSHHSLILKESDGNDHMITVHDYMKLSVDKQKKLFGYKSGEYILSKIKVSYVGKGKYYGWRVNQNHKFILTDFTIVKNCDQMYCTQCHTPFSWTRGTIETGVIHNPHFYEFQQQNNGGIAPRNAGDFRCGGPPTVWEINVRMSRSHNKDAMDIKNDLIKLHRLITHITHVELPRYPNSLGDMDNTSLRVEYLMGKINESQWHSRLKAKMKKQEKDGSINDVLTMFNTTCSDLISNIVECDDIDIAKYVDSLKELRNYTNKSLTKIGNQFSSVIPCIGDNLEFYRNHLKTDLTKKQKRDFQIAGRHQYLIVPHEEGEYEFV
jgi:hypothetical protein